MYLPEAFAVTDPDEVADLLGRLAFGTLVTHGPQGLFASQLPFLHDAAAGVLAGHLARANPHREAAGEGEALAIFQGLNAYVTPSWYPGKAVHGRVVPSWNYEAVHVYGRLTWQDEPAWLLANVEGLTAKFEAARPTPWAVSDAPADHIESRLRMIVGVELRIDRILAKRKLSQNRPAEDREGVIAGLEAQGDEAARRMAAAMRAAEG